MSDEVIPEVMREQMEGRRNSAEREIASGAALSPSHFWRATYAEERLLNEVDRLRAGVEALTHRPFTDERGQVYDFRNSAIAHRLHDLLNPTEGEDHERR